MSNSKMLNLGIIGTNWITDSFVVAAHSTSQWTLRAVYSRSLSTAQAFASKCTSSSTHDILTTTSLDDLANSPTLDAIYIASPNILHYTHAEKLLSAGKHVIVEKPSCSNLTELTHLFTLAHANNVFLLEAWRHIQEPNFSVLKTAIAEKLHGSPHGASLHYEQFSSRYDKLDATPTPSPFNLAMGGGALPDLGSYAVAAAIWLFGAPRESMYFPVRVSTGADGGGHLVLRYGDGFDVHLAASKMHDSAAPSEVYGHEGTLRVPSITDIQRVEFWDPRAKTLEVLAGEGTGVQKELNLACEAREFARIILEKDWETAKVLEEHSREVLRVTERARRENGLLFPGEK